MIRKRYALLFLLAVAVSLFATGTVFTLAGGKPLRGSFFYQFAINFPVCLFLGMLDVFVIDRIRKTGISRFNTARITLDMTLTSILALMVPGLCNFLLLDISLPDALKMSLPVIPWNWIMVLSIEIVYYRLEQERAEKEKLQYRYEVLKNQVNPHFLFNCLNVLSSLAYRDAEKANLFAKRLSSVYRYILDTRETDKVTLDEEMAFVRSYLYLESIRFDGRLRVTIRDNCPGTPRYVVPTSVQMLVENALKHNINTEASPLEIRIGMSGEGVSVSNNIQLRSHVSGHGVGLRNLMQQYMVHGKEMRVVRSGGSFTVFVPYL